MGNGDFYILCYLVCRQKSAKISKSINLSKKKPKSKESLKCLSVSLLRTTSQDSGSYRCVASNSFNQTDFFTVNSTEVVITVKGLLSSVVNELSGFYSYDAVFFEENNAIFLLVPSELVSNPDISFTVLKEDIHNYSAVVSCRSTRGTPPVTFSLYNSTEFIANVMTEERFATFKVPLVLGQHLGFLECQARNGDYVAYSEKIPLEVGMWKV